MAINRDIDPLGYVSGTNLANDIADTLNYVGGLTLGRLRDVSGTNDITATIDAAAGFASLTDGARAELIPSNNTTGAVTLKVNGGSILPVYDSDGEALEDGDLKKDRAYPIQYDGVDSGWRVLVDVPSQKVIANQSDVPPYSIYDEITASGMWTAPFDCFVRIWLFGGGASGRAGGATNSRGGGGAAVCIKDRYFMTAGQQLSLTIGLGGAGVSPTRDGNNGGDSTCTGPNGLNMSAGGGKGGNATNGVGGVATGGDLNYAGQTRTSSSASGSNGLALKFTSNISRIGPFSSGMVNAVSSAGAPSGDSSAGTAGMAVIEYTTAIS